MGYDAQDENGEPGFILSERRLKTKHKELNQSVITKSVATG